MTVVELIAALLPSLLGSRAALAAENLARRQQLAVLRRSVSRPRLLTIHIGALPRRRLSGSVHRAFSAMACGHCR